MRIGPVGPQTPKLGKIEHLRDDLNVAVRLVGAIPPVVMIFGDIGAGHVDDAQMPNGGKDEEFQVPADIPWRCWA